MACYAQTNESENVNNNSRRLKRPDHTLFCSVVCSTRYLSLKPIFHQETVLVEYRLKGKIKKNESFIKKRSCYLTTNYFALMGKTFHQSQVTIHYCINRFSRPIQKVVDYIELKNRGK